ncbi:DUF5994 family protein [Streptomyces luteolifulvus]|uniref:DUF5994 family protein n=1 Tax=Streptomyces luteolifulvus TaxID=2615112 RepID=UPI001E3F6E89|nr:DUF5994 family protein [Streptomyces luteolifulvus]
MELELPSLVAALERGRGRGRGTTVAVTVDAAQWPDVPHTVMAPGRVIAWNRPDPRARSMSSPWTAGSAAAVADICRLEGRI